MSIPLVQYFLERTAVYLDFDLELRKSRNEDAKKLCQRTSKVFLGNCRSIF